MNKIKKRLNFLAQKNKIGLMTHVVAGCPYIKMSEKIIDLMLKKVDFLEIQLPFSDPVADGKVMMKANQVALENNTKVKDAFSLAEKICKKTEIPIFFMGYFNLIYKMGVEKFCQKCSKIGISGLIFPDIPFDEARNEKFLFFCQKFSLPIIQVVSENTSEERLKKIASLQGELIYCQSRFGTTGVGKNFSKKLPNFLRKVKNLTKKSLAVGFGISSRQDILKVTKNVEVAVIGSKIMSMALDEKLKDQDKLKQIDQFIDKILI